MQSEVPGLPEHLLGSVLLADDLPAARALAVLHPACRVVTRAGELLDPDGTVTVGPPRTEAGLLSRKSELRDLREQVAALETDIHAAEAEQLDLRRRADALDPDIHGRNAEIAALADTAGDLRERIVRLTEKRDRLAAEVQLIASESAIAVGELEQAEAAANRAASEASEADEAAAAVKTRLEAADAELRSAEAEKALRQAADTDARVALGRAVQTRDTLAAKVRELDDELRRRKYDAFNLAQDDRSARERRTDAELGVLRATQAAADAYREKEARERLAGEWAVRRAAVRVERDRVSAVLAADRDARQARQAAAHERELAVRDLSARRDAVAGRVREDYGVELAETPPAAAPADAGAEVEDLKRKLAKLGSVNLEALDQLATEEAREKQIRGEFDDLTAAEKSLLEIIEQINTDSRRLFDDTLNAVRGHFQELFRKLFGGGQADIVLDDPADPLESGIEITARPPGKELRSISLMSGGEKTLTAVALLLAVFRSKPSPFCLLDEVDAALDEANTGRLATAVREFLDRSQFIVITHKKRTMAAADVLFGITMQESGVSKQVAARLEDWPDEVAEAA